jgi:hypothetical protein
MTTRLRTGISRSLPCGPMEPGASSRPWLTAHRALLAMLLALVFSINLVWVMVIIGDFDESAADWELIAEAGRRALQGENPYLAGDVVGAYRYAPLYALLAGLAAPLGVLPWRVLSAASLLLLPRRLGLIAAISFPFWYDLQVGNITTLMAVLAFLSVQGKGWAQVAYLTISVLIPRPLMLPVALWILWHRRLWWPWFIGAAALYAAASWATGWVDEWFSVLSSVSAGLEGKTFLGWQRLVGSWWWVIALPLAGALMWRGRMGLASIAISPHIVPYYWLFLLVEERATPWARLGTEGSRRDAGGQSRRR